MKTSNSTLPSGLDPSPYSPEEGIVVVSYCESGKFRKVDFDKAVSLTVRELCNQPFVFRFDIPRQGRVYFVGEDEAYLKLRKEGKQVRWIYELIEYWRQDLILRGFPPDTSIYHWRLKDISILQRIYTVFPGSKLGVKQ